jgi:hypothetical protein
MMSTKLGTAKVYFTKEDLGKMLKLKDKDNLMVIDVSVDNTEGKVAITITTPMDNITNDRVKTPEGTARKRNVDNDRNINNLFFDESDKDEFLHDNFYMFMRHLMILPYEEVKEVYRNNNYDYYDIEHELESRSRAKLNQNNPRYSETKHQLKIFEHSKEGHSYKLIVDTEILVNIDNWINPDYQSTYNSFAKLLAFHNVITRDCEEKDGMIMINNQTVIFFEIRRGELSIDIIPSFIMDYFIDWYRKEYEDNKFNGNYEYEQVCNMLKLS